MFNSSGKRITSRPRRALAVAGALAIAASLFALGGGPAGAQQPEAERSTVEGAGAIPRQQGQNPYEGATPYVNPDWAANASAEPGGDAIADEPTAVWMDRTAAIEGTDQARGLREHLDTAVEQGANLFQVVIYNLPGRDCSALASNGELGPNEIGRYKSEFIDPIAEILSDPAYADLRIVAVIEIDSLPNLITNTGDRPTATPECDEMLANGNYVNGVAYALGTLGAIPNVYNYVDIGHHGWLGWEDNFQPTADLMGEVANTAPASGEDIFGFAANVANYGALHEEHFALDDVVGGRPIREIPGTEGGWIDYNNYIDEASYAKAYAPVLAEAVGHDVSMIIDTSRNGWGDCNQEPCQPIQDARPTETSTSEDPVTYMDESRIDRRIHTGNWCNQRGAGLGERPQASPEEGIDAYVWIKPPGESDGSSKEIPNDEGKGFDRMCDPTYEGNPRNGNNPSGAHPDAPLSGHWFSAQFQQLLANAHPPL